MSTHVLVVYGSKHGATKEIAEKIGQVLRDGGLTVDVKDAKQVGSPASYGAVVLGSAVYIGAWRKEAAAFLTDNADALAKLPVWIFSSGPTGEGDPKELVQGQLVPPKLEPIVSQIQPRDIAVFHGSSATKMGFLEKWIVKKVSGAEGDFRDWEMITAWAESIAGALNG